MHRFVRGLHTDHAAILNGLTLPYSSGAVEGHVNRIKMLKRQCTDAPDSTSSANEYSSAADVFKIDHGKWARTNSNPSLTPSSEWVHASDLCCCRIDPVESLGPRSVWLPIPHSAALSKHYLAIASNFDHCMFGRDRVHIASLHRCTGSAHTSYPPARWRSGDSDVECRDRTVGHHRTAVLGPRENFEGISAGSGG